MASARAGPATGVLLETSRRSGSYAARYVAKNIVGAGLADRCTVQVAYAIGVEQPVSVMVDSHGTGKVPDSRLEEKDLEVGQYYMRKGDLDAAIDRFQDATEAKPGYAVPFKYLGEAQEKKGLKKQAIKSYQRYLDLYPHAEDGDKVRKKIEKLWKETEKDKKQN